MNDMMLVDCPICARPVAWNEQSRYKPFCSSRCKLTDLGEWASEERCISAGEMPDHEQWSEQEIHP